MAVAESAGKGDELTEQILRLQNEEKEMRTKKKRVQADLRNAKRKKSRLTKRAKLLTDSDLFQIMQMREAKKKEDPAAPSKENEAKPRSRAQPSQTAKPPRHRRRSRRAATLKTAKKRNRENTK